LAEPLGSPFSARITCSTARGRTLGKTFPLADRWFGSVLAQTYPNRRFLKAGTAAGSSARRARH